MLQRARSGLRGEAEQSATRPEYTREARSGAASGLLYGIDNRQKREMTEIAVAGAYSAHAVLAHQHGCVKIVHQVPAKVGKFGNCLRQNCCVTRSWNQQVKPG